MSLGRGVSLAAAPPAVFVDEDRFAEDTTSSSGLMIFLGSGEIAKPERAAWHGLNQCDGVNTMKDRNGSRISKSSLSR